MQNILAHVKWFTSTTPTEQPGLDAGEWLIVFSVVIFGVKFFDILSKQLDKKGVTKKLNSKLSTYSSIAPLAVRLSTAAFIIINMQQGYILAPNVLNHGASISFVITSMFALAASMFIIGAYTRLAAALLASGYLLVLGIAEPVEVLEHLEYIAIAGYLWFRGPGKYSLAYYSMGKLKLPRNARLSLPVYRVWLGAGLAVLGLSEKLLNMTAAQDFLRQHNWNFLSSVGVDDRLFIVFVGSVELTIGVSLILNKAPRVLISAVLFLMIITAWLLGIQEVYGHLFAVGAVAVLLINDLKPKN